MTRILLVRHGQTTWNLEARYQGRRESPLSTLGREQAESLAAALAAEPLAAVYASPLRRSLETAEAIAARHGLPVVVEPRLVEVAHGPFDGLLTSEIAVRYAEEWDAWRRDPTTLRLPGAESFEAVQARGTEALREIAAGHEGATVAVVSHGGIIRATLLAILRAPPTAYWRVRLDNGGITTVAADEGPWRVVSLNATEHLRRVVEGMEE